MYCASSLGKTDTMPQKTFTGTWLPAWVPESSRILSVLLIVCAAVQSAVSNFSPPTGLPMLERRMND